jgi:hypothetical protein
LAKTTEGTEGFFFILNSFSLGFACYISYVIVTDMIEPVLETSECFLSTPTNPMHIIYSWHESQEVEIVHAIYPKVEMLPPISKKLTSTGL